jgi:hypothetical protein
VKKNVDPVPNIIFQLLDFFQLNFDDILYELEENQTSDFYSSEWYFVGFLFI